MRKGLILLGFAAAAFGAVGRPGTINYVEGQVTVEGRAVAAKGLGQTELAPGRMLETGQGKAEMLLTPGVFLRLGDNSAVRMVSPSLTDTRVELVRGRALLEVDLLQKENRLVVRDGGSNVRVEKKGIYKFDADVPLVAVYDGKATAQVDDHEVEVKKGKELPLTPSATAEVKPQKFDKDQDEKDELMAWSKLRSQYLAEANASSVNTVVVNNPSWWGGTGWYWNPGYATWSFIPGSGFYDNPWGFGFYSPNYWAWNPPMYYYPRPVIVGRPSVPAQRPGGRTWAPVGRGMTGVARPSAPAAAAPAMRPSAPMGRSSAPMGAAPMGRSAPVGGGSPTFGGHRGK
jgi:hypothetical protein